MSTRPPATRLQELLAIMARLRAADGCPWDREQTASSLVSHTIEEAYEVADAVERGDLQHLKDELGDLLFQVVFQAQIASEANHFDFEAVAGAICDKLRRRHPHVFGEPGEAASAKLGQVSAAEQSVIWEDIKARERAAAAAATTHGEARFVDPAGDPAGDLAGRAADHQAGQLDGVPKALPALTRACKISKRAARVGFDFEHVGQTADKVSEELAEVREAAALAAALAAARNPAADAPDAGPTPEIFEEIGDLLFAAANLARKLNVDAEAALRGANAKFERRFRGMEALARQRGEVFADLSLEAQERLWQAVKRAE
jgi:MazG family protein